jgi:hypothetical protein
MAFYLYLYRLISIIILLLIRLKLKLIELIDKYIINNLSRLKLELYRKLVNVDNSENEFYFILCGAAITIQAVWRGYMCRKAFKKSDNILNLNKNNNNNNSINDEFEDENMSNASIRRAVNNKVTCNSYFRNDFLCDVIINVEDKQYKCHSVVLWCNSGYFKKVFKVDYLNKQNNNYHFEIYTSSKCWEIVQLFIYGHSVIIYEHLLNDLLKLVEQLEMKELLKEIKHATMTSSSLLACSSSSLTRKSRIENSKSKTICLDSKQPLQLLNSYYLFFKCVINFHMTKKLTLNETLKYLSSSYINYSKMNEKELFNCIYLLKTKIKIQNSSLIPELINNYLKTKS